MKGTFKESEIEIEVIDLSEGRKDKVLYNDFGVVVLPEGELQRYKALETTNKLLQKCLDEATEDRDRYKRQLNELNIMFDKYIRREKNISPSSHKSCCMCKYYNLRGYQCRCKLSDNYNEITDLGYSCERFEEE